MASVLPEGMGPEIPASVLAGSALLGAILARDEGGPISDRFRGGLKGLGAGAGGLGGFLLANSLSGGNTPVNVGGGLAGAVAGHLAAAQLARALGVDRHRPPERPVLDYVGIKASAANPTLNRLLEAKTESDRRNYARKHMLLRELIRAHPAEFIVDSDEDGMVGLTHLTGFRIHMPKHLLPVPVPVMGRPAYALGSPESDRQAIRAPGSAGASAGRNGGPVPDAQGAQGLHLAVPL